MFMLDWQFIGRRLLIVLMTVVLATAPMLHYILPYLVTMRNAVMPNVHPPRHVSHQEAGDRKKAR